MKILCVHDGLGCGHVRLVQPLTQMAKHGHDVRFVHSQTPEAIEAMRDAKDYDIVIGQRFAGYMGLGLWRRSRYPSNRLVYETDDNLFSIGMDNWAAYTQFMKPEVQEAIKGYCMTSDLVTVTTQTLAQVHLDHGANKVAVLPNCIPQHAIDTPRSSESRRPRIGWLGAGSHGADMLELVTPVRRFLKKNPDWDLFLGGTDYRPTFNLTNWDRMIFEEWRQINDGEGSYYDMLDFDIGMIPVRDTEFARSKSALKALEYNARGIPVVASDVQPYREYVQHGYNGFLAKTEKDWSQYLRLLAEDEELREQMGKNGKFEASKHTYENNWSKWEAAYEELF